MKAAKVITRRISGKGYGSFHSDLKDVSRMAEHCIVWRVSRIGISHTFTDVFMELRHNVFRISHEPPKN